MYQTPPGKSVASRGSTGWGIASRFIPDLTMKHLFSFKTPTSAGAPSKSKFLSVRFDVYSNPIYLRMLI